jgi:arginyl-tRNA synthetase
MKKLMLIPAIALISGCMQTTPQKTHSFDNEFKILNKYNISIIDGINNETTSFKIALSDLTSLTISRSLNLLGIDVPEKM